MESGFKVPNPDYSKSDYPDVYFTHVEDQTIVQYSIRNTDCYEVKCSLVSSCSFYMLLFPFVNFSFSLFLFPMPCSYFQAQHQLLQFEFSADNIAAFGDENGTVTQTIFTTTCVSGQFSPPIIPVKRGTYPESFPLIIPVGLIVWPFFFDLLLHICLMILNDLRYW